jgi:tetratricopeptide (TPR) repeat protein
LKEKISFNVLLFCLLVITLTPLEASAMIHQDEEGDNGFVLLRHLGPSHSPFISSRENLIQQENKRRSDLLNFIKTNLPFLEEKDLYGEYVRRGFQRANLYFAVGAALCELNEYVTARYFFRAITKLVDEENQYILVSRNRALIFNTLGILFSHLRKWKKGVKAFAEALIIGSKANDVRAKDVGLISYNCGLSLLQWANIKSLKNVFVMLSI